MIPIRGALEKKHAASLLYANYHYRLVFFAAWFFSAFAVNLGRADLPTQDQLEELFACIHTHFVTLAPDGRHLAYDLRETNRNSIVVVPIDHPENSASIKVDGEISSLGWPNSGEFVYARAAGGIQEIITIEADGRNQRVLSRRETKAKDRPIRLRVVSFASSRPDEITVEATYFSHPPVERLADGKRTFIAMNISHINVRSGKNTTVYDGPLEGEVIYDQQGEARVIRLLSVYLHDQPVRLLAKSAGLRFGPELESLLPNNPRAAFLTIPENELGERSIPLGFDGDGNTLFYGSNVGRKTYALYALDLKNKKDSFVLDDASEDLVDPSVHDQSQTLIYDRALRKIVGLRYSPTHHRTRWLDTEMAQIQGTIAGRFPDREVEISEWDEKRERFLLFVSGGTEPGRSFVFERKTGLASQFVRSAPALGPDEINPTSSFAFETGSGVHLAGTMIEPLEPAITPPPMVIRLHDGLWGHSPVGFSSEGQALARMGVLVADFNYRGSLGFGRDFFEVLKKGDAASLEDIYAATQWLSQHYKIDAKKIALFGEDFGGHLALRALAAHPEMYRCAVAINAPLNLVDWIKDRRSTAVGQELRGWAGAEIRAFDGMTQTKGMPGSGGVVGDGSSGAGTAGDESYGGPRFFFDDEVRQWVLGNNPSLWKLMSMSEPHELLTKPVFLAQNVWSNPLAPKTMSKWSSEQNVLALRNRIIQNGGVVTYVESNYGYERGDAGERARIFAQIETFFNLYLYSFKVELGATKTRE